jgi:hypothetical protein
VLWPLRRGQALVLSPQREAGPTDAWCYASAPILTCALAQTRACGRRCPRLLLSSRCPRRAIGLATRRSSAARQARCGGRLLSSRDQVDRDASYRRNSGMFGPER